MSLLPSLSSHIFKQSQMSICFKCLFFRHQRHDRKGTLVPLFCSLFSSSLGEILPRPLRRHFLPFSFEPRTCTGIAPRTLACSGRMCGLVKQKTIYGESVCHQLQVKEDRQDTCTSLYVNLTPANAGLLSHIRTYQFKSISLTLSQDLLAAHEMSQSFS